MRIPRIYYQGALHSQLIITLETEASNHLLRVLRLKPHARLILFNGRGGEYEATLTGVKNKLAIVQVENYIECNVESPLIIHLAQALVRSEKMDFIIQKAVELGVNKITPLLTENCEVKLSDDRMQKKLEHWRGIIINACEQSGRTIIPELNSMTTFRDFITHQKGLCCVLHNYAQKTFADIDSKPKAVTLAVGPEGGFSEQEVEIAKQNHWQIIVLGPRILRTETAGLAGITAVQVLFGDAK